MGDGTGDDCADWIGSVGLGGGARRRGVHRLRRGDRGGGGTRSRSGRRARQRWPGRLDVDLDVADDAAAGTDAIAREADGTLHLAFGLDAGGERRIAYATDATGSWVVEPVGPGSSVTADQDPSLAVDAAGHVLHRLRAGLPVADRDLDPLRHQRERLWVIWQRTTGAPHDLGPRIALDAAGRPRIAFLREGSGVRLQAFTGSSWTSKTVSSGADDADPSLAIDAAGRAHVLFAAGRHARRGLWAAAVLGAPWPPLVERRARRGTLPPA